MRWRRAGLLALAGVGVVGCSSDPYWAQSIMVSCALADLCAQVPIARVDATCGTSAVSTSYTSVFGASDGIDTCAYNGPAGTAFQIRRTCVPTASDARLNYQAASNSSPPPGVTREVVNGVADLAFIQTSADPLQADLYALGGNLVVHLEDDEPSATGWAELCLGDLATDVFAAVTGRPSP